MATLSTTTSENTNVIISYLSHVPEGYSVTRDEITRATGVDVATPRGARYLDAARAAMLDQSATVFKFTSGKLVRLSDEEKVAEAARKSSIATRTSAKARAFAEAVMDFDAMSSDAKETHTQVMIKSSIISHVAKPMVLTSLANEIKKRGGSGSISGRDFLTMLSSSPVSL